MKILAVIQARMQSSRLPGKVLKDLAGKPVLWHIYNRLSACKTIDEIIVATSVDSSNDSIEDFCTNNDIEIFRGSEDDVLDRFYQAAIKYNADAVLRITADCPLIDPDVVDRVVNTFIEGQYDFAGHDGEFPDGLDCEVFSFSALEKSWNEAKLPSEREHVTPYILKNPDIFYNQGVFIFQGLDHLRLTLDQTEDYRLMQKIYEDLYNTETIFKIKDILEYLDEYPELLKINNSIKRNEGYTKSLAEDQKWQSINS